MEQKAWPWRKKSSEKTIIISEKTDLSPTENEVEKEKSLEIERSLQDLHEQLLHARNECDAKDGMLAKQAKVAEEAIAGWEKAEAEAVSYKQNLDDALFQKQAAEDRIIKMDTSLTECMQQKFSLQEEKQQIVRDSAMQISGEQEKTRLLEKRLAETNKRLSKLVAENNSLHVIHEGNEKLLEDLKGSKSQSEANFTAIVEKLDSLEKINASLKYEVCMLQKELEIRNEEREFNLKSSDAAHKQHLENIKKIGKLENECQRLRVMVRKRLPGPAALAKMRTEVEMLETGASQTRKKQSTFTTNGLRLVPENYYDASGRNVASLIERLHSVEDENKILKETLTKKSSEIQSLRVMFARTASKLSQAEAQLDDLSKGKASFEQAKISSMSYELTLGSISEDGYNDDSASCTESWASALISELEHFKQGKMTPTRRTSAVSELSLMDDFVEMEKMAIVCMDKPFESSCVTPRERNACGTQESNSKSETCIDLVLVDNLSEVSETSHRNETSSISFEKHPNWIQDILKVVLKRHRCTQRSLDTILEEVRVALGKRDSPVKGNRSDDLFIRGNAYMNSQLTPESFDKALSSSETSNLLYQSGLEKSLPKLIELLEGIIRRCTQTNSGQQILSGNNGAAATCDIPPSLTGYASHAFIWKSSELSTVLQRFINACKNLLYCKADIGNFANELASTLDWMNSHYCSLQDVSDIEEMTKKKSEGKESKLMGIERVDKPEGFKFDRYLPLLTCSNGLYFLSQMEDIESKLKDENKRLTHEFINMEALNKDLEEKLESVNARSNTLITQHQESKESISKLELELGKLKESKGLVEYQIENQKLINEDLRTQLTVVREELNKTRQNFSALKVELEDKCNLYNELEATCLEQQLQLESASAKETTKYHLVQEEKQLRTDWEISTASRKLAECQETILILGKQLKSMASPRHAALFDKAISTPDDAKILRRTRLLDHMRAEDDATPEDLKSPKTKEMICAELQKSSSATPVNRNVGLLYGQNMHANHGTGDSLQTRVPPSPMKLHEKSYGSESSDDSDTLKAETNAAALAIVPLRQKEGVGLLRKLLSRRKKRSSKKLMLPIGS